MIAINKLSWIINNACNLKCIHCYPNSGLESRKAFSENEFETLRKNLSSAHFSRVFLSGGEPIIDVNFNKYLDIAKQISDEVYLCSNGTLLTDSKLLHWLKAFSPIYVTLDGNDICLSPVQL